MKTVYPIIMMKDGDFVFVTVPDLDINTQGNDYFDAIEMARDAIGLYGIAEQDAGRELPIVTDLAPKHEEGAVVTLVDIDFDEYRKRQDNRAVRKNCTIPYWLNVQAEKAHLNFSAVLQEALKAKIV